MSDDHLIPPALAYPFEEKRLAKGVWIAEQKWDGHRMLSRVDGDEAVTCWSRGGKRMDNIPRHVRETIRLLPHGVYDGELVQAGDSGKSYGVSSARGGGGTGAASETLRYVVFDILARHGLDLCLMPYRDRRKELEHALVVLDDCDRAVVVLSQQLGTDLSAEVLTIRTAEQAYAAAEPVWYRGGEGLILKETSGIYRPGKRMQSWMKVKRLETAVVALVGLLPGLMGPCSIALLEDADGRQVQVKWKNHAWLELMLSQGAAFVEARRQVRIEFTERTEGGGYREPRWDRWEDE